VRDSIAVNASLVGANTVIEPGAERASTRLAVVKAVTKDDKSAMLSAVCTMFIVGAAVGPADVVKDVVEEGKPFGINTALTTCTTPFVHTTFAIVTWTEFVSPVIVTVPGTDKSTVRLFSANSVSNCSLGVNSVDKAETPPMT